MTGLPRTVQQPFEDEGDPQQVAEVRRFVVAALSAEVNAYRRTDAAGGLTGDERVAEVAVFEAPALAAAVREGPPLTMPPAFAQAQFRPVRWEGVAVLGDRAKAYVIGHHVFRSLDGAASRLPASQVQVLLRREPAARHGWLVVAVAAVGDERITSIDPGGAGT